MVRKIYLDMLREKLTGGNFLWPTKAGYRYLLTRLSIAAGKPLCGPILGTLIVTYRCNYNCAMCDMPAKAAQKAGQGREELGTDAMIAAIDQLASLGTMGIGFTGGEPLLRKDILQLLEHSKKIGMVTHLNTNGSLLARDVIKDLLETGLDSLNISLDAATPTVHDSIRGVSGAWDAATQAVRDVVDLRAKRGKTPRLKLVMVVGHDNVEEIPGMVDLAADLGVECVEYIPQQPFLEVGGETPTEGREQLAQRAARLLNIARISARDRVKIENSPRMLALFPAALRGEPSPISCYAGYNSITVDCYSSVFACLPWANWRRFPLDPGDMKLQEFWRSDMYRRARLEVTRCHECTLNCQAELNLLFQPLKRV